MIGTYKEVNYILHRNCRRKNVDVDTNMDIRKASRNIETPPKSPQDKKANIQIYVHTTCALRRGGT